MGLRVSGHLKAVFLFPDGSPQNNDVGNKALVVFEPDGMPFRLEATATKMPKRITQEERIQKARELNQAGLSLRRIAAMLGVSVGTAHNYVNGYPCKATTGPGHLEAR